MTDRDYYYFHRHSPSTEDFLGKTINARSNGQPTFFLTRRINDRHGNLLAIVVVGLRHAFFDSFFNSISADKPFSILLARKDDTVLVWSDLNKRSDERHHIPPLPELHPPRPADKEENAPYFFMQSHWLGIHRPVRGSPLYLEVAVTDQVYFSDWLESMYPLMSVAAIALLGLVGGFALTLRQVQRREQDALLAMQLKDAADQANEAKSRFLAMVSHEIRTPMNGIMGLSELLIESGLSTRQQHYANSIHGATEGLVRIINDILDISKIESGKLDLETMPFHPARLVREISELYRPSIQHKDVEFDVRIDCDEALVLLGEFRHQRQRHRYLGRGAGSVVPALHPGRQLHRPPLRRYWTGPGHQQEPGGTDGRPHRLPQHPRAVDQVQLRCALPGGTRYGAIGSAGRPGR